MSVKVCDKCSSEQDAKVAKCADCGNDTFTPLRTVEAIEKFSLVSKPAEDILQQQDVTENSQSDLGIHVVYLGAIAYFLKALWLVTLSAIFGQWATSQFATVATSDQPSIFGFWVLPAIVSFVVMLLAGFAGFEAVSRLNKAG